MKQVNPLERFSGRAGYYARYRPGYPGTIVSHLCEKFGWQPELEPIADIGSGTGLLALPFLKAGFTVKGVEPNDSMRQMAEQTGIDLPGFHAVDGTAEDTGLDSSSVQGVIAGQAFHWFDPKAASIEFARICSREVQVALIWNKRLPASSRSPFEADYDSVVEEFADHRNRVAHQYLTRADFDRLFTKGWSLSEFTYAQHLNATGLLGRLISASYMPDEQYPRFKALEKGVREIFNRHHEDGFVCLRYRTLVYSGEL